MDKGASRARKVGDLVRTENNHDVSFYCTGRQGKGHTRETLPQGLTLNASSTVLSRSADAIALRPARCACVAVNKCNIDAICLQFVGGGYA